MENEITGRDSKPWSYDCHNHFVREGGTGVLSYMKPDKK